MLHLLQLRHKFFRAATKFVETKYCDMTCQGLKGVKVGSENNCYNLYVFIFQWEGFSTEAAKGEKATAAVCMLYVYYM